MASKRYPDLLTSDTIDDAHRKVVDFVRDFQRTKGYGPKVEEIANGTGLVFATTRDHVRRLEKSGFLVRPDGIYRALRVARDDEHKEVLHKAWLERLRKLPPEELHAAVAAATQVKAERIQQAGEPPPS